MCGRYNVTKKLETIETELSIQIIQKELFEDLVNIAPGNMAPVITHPNIKEASFMRFGLTPFWSKKPMYLFNARMEGNENKENHEHYSGNKGILQKPSFRKPIRSQRCLVIANSFIEGTTEEKLSRPYLIFRDDFKTFTLGGIWDEWVNRETGEIIQSFSIITTPPNSITKLIGHHRAPLIIEPENRNEWLDPDTDLNRITQLLHPFDGDSYNAYLIDKAIKSGRDKNIEHLLPQQPPLRPIVKTKIVEGLELLGMGESPARKRRAEPDG